MSERRSGWRETTDVLAAPVAVVLALSIPAGLEAWRSLDRGRQRTTMRDMRTIATAVESYSIDWNAYPLTGPTAVELAPFLEPTYVKTLPVEDGWGRPLRYTTNEWGSLFRLESFGADGRDSGWDDQSQVPADDHRRDIVFQTPPWPGPD